jgi:hypothetical protein
MAGPEHDEPDDSWVRFALGPARFYPRLTLTVLRPEDNLVLEISSEGLDSILGDDGLPRLVRNKDATKARLIVGFPPQHVAEQVFQEQRPIQEGGGPEDPILPARALFAAPSRLVFDVAEGDRISLTVEGILEAMSRLPMAVVSLAVPRRYGFARPVRDVIAAGDVIRVGAVGIATHQGAALTMERVRATRVLAASGLGSRVRELDRDGRRMLLELPASDRGSAIADFRERSGPDFGGVTRHLLNPEPRPPTFDETTIEIPSRLELSPSDRGGWAHAVSLDQERGDGTGPVELWHSRLGVRHVHDGNVTIDEDDPDQRVVRGIWTRDLSAWPSPPPSVPALPPAPFRMSTAPGDRYQIVGRSTGVGLPLWTNVNPVDVNRLALSSLGAFIDLRGAWPSSDDWSLLEWQHRATLGRDQYVKVVYDGYLFPFGHRAVLVKETRRKVEPSLPESGDTAILWQRYFLVLKDTTRDYSQRSMPFTSITISPPTSPDIDDPGEPLPTHTWPAIGSEPYRFTISAVDHDGHPHVFSAPLLWVQAPMNDPATPAGVLADYGLQLNGAVLEDTAQNATLVRLPLFGQRIAVAPSAPSGQAAYETDVLRFAAIPLQHTSDPSLLFAELVVPAVAAATGQRTTHSLTFAKPYLDAGFEAANAGEVVLEVAAGQTAHSFSFGSSDRSGGFLNPGQVLEGLSRRTGPIADVANAAAGAQVSPVALFGSVGKLFGLFDIADLLGPLDPKDLPAYASEIIDLAAALDGELDRLPGLLPDSPAEVAAAKAALANAAAALDALKAAVPADLDAAKAQFKTLIDSQLRPAVENATKEAVLEKLDLARRAIVERTLDTLSTLLASPAPLPPPEETLARLARGEPVASTLNHLHLEWSPPLKTIPIFTPQLNGKSGSLLLAVDVRGGDLVRSPSAAVVAQLSNFSLDLLPSPQLLSIGFERLLFTAGTGRKTDVDVVIDDLTWKGILGFVEDLKDLIPLDGFSDPPSLTVDASGISAGFSAGLPNVAVGIFNLSNLSLGADLKLPFLGPAPSVGFSFCSRERPFTLAVMIFGGGGFFGLRLNPKEGVVLLEAALEFGAVAALDFVVASGSVSCMAGVYFRLEASNGSLTGYLRIRGEVDVLGLISAAIEMYMSLAYEFGSGKVVGRATITVEIEILMLSESVSISAERKFSGSAGDPTFADTVSIDDGSWLAYCQAFAGT